MRTLPLLVAAATLAACSGSAPGSPNPHTTPYGELPAGIEEEMALLVTRLGDDTLAIERIHRNEAGAYWAMVVQRSPRTTLRVYRWHGPTSDTPDLLTILEFDPAWDGIAEPTSTQEIDLARGSGIPFIDMVHWPFELMVQRAMAGPADTITLELVAGDRLVPFRMERLGNGRFTATHPTRGTMTLEADPEGRLLSLDAARTTRALQVTRAADALMRPFAVSFAARPLGDLSGRGEVAVTVAGADIGVDYGVPMKRGREIFGALVPWDRVWRTGANRATHFSTTRPLRVGDALIPAGSYTLFTIPRPDRWTLIVNRNIDINGQAYDPAADLVHLDLAVRRLDQVVEPFTIVVEPDGPNGGILRLRWDTTEAWLPFAVE